MIMIIITVVVVLAAWFVQNIIHEGAHLIMAYNKMGWPPLAFKPYPCKVDGRWYFAYCKYDVSCGNGGPGKRSDIHIAPFYTGMAWFCLWFCVNLILWSATESWHWLFLAPMVTGLVDALLFWWGYFWGSVYTDGKKYKYLKGSCDD